MKKQLQEAQELQVKGDGKLTNALTNLRQLQEEKSNLETKLGQKQATLQAQVIRRGFNKNSLRKVYSLTITSFSQPLNYL